MRGKTDDFPALPTYLRNNNSKVRLSISRDDDSLIVVVSANLVK